MEGYTKKSLQLDEDSRTLDGRDGDNNDLRLTSSEQDLCEYPKKGGEGYLSKSCPSTTIIDNGKEEEHAYGGGTST